MPTHSKLRRRIAAPPLDDHHLSEVRGEALREIARLSPSEQPGDQEHDDLEAAEAHGLRLGLWEAASIARRALAAGQDEQPAEYEPSYDVQSNRRMRLATSSGSSTPSPSRSSGGCAPGRPTTPTVSKTSNSM